MPVPPLFSGQSSRMAMIPYKTNTMIMEIQIGDSTHTQLHVMTPKSFNTMKMIASTSQTPRLADFLLLIVCILHYFPVEPQPPFLTPSAASEYVIPNGRKMVCTKRSPALISSTFS